MRFPGEALLTPRSQCLAVLRVCSGNFLEMYDFIVFGFYAGPIGHAYFPSQDPFVSLMASFAAPANCA